MCVSGYAGLQGSVTLPRALSVPLLYQVESRERLRWRFYLSNHIVASRRSEDTREISEGDQNTKGFDPDNVVLDNSAGSFKPNTCSTRLMVQKKIK